ncbi:Protein of unknown function DUF716 [Dillenia turbinata]|uniref:Uncharacterized protein n=1 Tax=Dillenia turbinata TaxID=194707 RepID=A0AAN8UJD9_9MAGN
MSSEICVIVLPQNVFYSVEQFALWRVFDGDRNILLSMVLTINANTNTLSDSAYPHLLYVGTSFLTIMPPPLPPSRPLSLSLPPPQTHARARSPSAHLGLSILESEENSLNFKFQIISATQRNVVTMLSTSQRILRWEKGFHRWTKNVPSSYISYEMVTWIRNSMNPGKAMHSLHRMKIRLYTLMFLKENMKIRVESLPTLSITSLLCGPSMYQKGKEGLLRSLLSRSDTLVDFLRLEKLHRAACKKENLHDCAILQALPMIIEVTRCCYLIEVPMGTFQGHLVPGLAITLLGLWHACNTIHAYYLKGSGRYMSRFWYPFNSPIQGLKYLELILILSFTIFAIITQVLNFPLLNVSFQPDSFEHSTMFLHLGIFAVFTFSSELSHSAEAPSGFVGILASSVFGQELFLLHYHSADHVGLEGHYHWLLQLIVFVSFMAALATTSFPTSFPAALVLAISVIFQGCWFMNMGFTLWVPRFIPWGCIARLAEPSTDKALGPVMCMTHEAGLRAKALANLQFSWILAGILVLTTDTAGKLGSDYDFQRGCLCGGHTCTFSQIYHLNPKNKKKQKDWKEEDRVT